LLNLKMCLIFNWDQTGLNYVPKANWMMEKGGAKRLEIKGLDDKRQITAVSWRHDYRQISACAASISG